MQEQTVLPCFIY